MLGKLDIHMQNKKIETLHYRKYKSQFKVLLTVWIKTKKVNIYNIDIGNNFMDMAL